ncbi:MAG: hypothetical protein M0Z99_13785, partial [Betaproteobacteria bacterium]|nr:hypothetical protein [Betaproteobacteria bacterium]
MNTRFRLCILAAAMLASASPAWAVTGGTTTGATGGVTQQDTTNNNLASGNGATTNAVSQYQTAVGAGAFAVGTGATALGGKASATSGANTTALGYQATTTGSYSTAVGAGANVAAPSGTALGAGSTAGGNNTTALGQGASASGTNSVAVGQGAQANAGSVGYQGTAVGSGATATGINSVALGYASTDGGAANVVSVGSSAQTREIINVSAGTTGTSAVNVNQLNAAIAGVSSSAGAAQYTSSTGATQSTPSNTATLVGATSGQTNGGPVTLTNVGNGAVSSGSLDAVNGGQLYGVQQTATSAQATAGQALTLANNSAQYSTGGAALGLNSNGGVGTLVQNVAAGQAATDAANVGQIQAAAADAVTTANAYTTQQIQALQSIINNATASGLCKYNPAGGIVCGANTTAAAGAVAQGDGASAGYAGSLAIGQGATITAPTSNDGMTAGAVAIGFGARANADPATAIGYQANAGGANSVALGYAATANGSNSVALGAQSVANRPNSVSVGDASTGLQRQITNVAPGTAPSDAATVGQVAGMVSQATSGILSQANAHADGVAAMAAAVSTPPRFGPLGYSLTAGVAGVGSASAVGVSFARAFSFHDHPAYWSAGVGLNGRSGAAMVK